MQIKQTFVIDGKETISLPPIPPPRKVPQICTTSGTLLSVTEVATIIGVTPTTIRRWAKAGKLGHVRLSKVDLRFRRADIDEFVGSRLHRRKGVYR